MAETNLLNPSATHTLNPDFGYSEGLPVLVNQWQARSGRPYGRINAARGRTFDLEWHERLLADKVSIQQWHQQYENGFFTFVDWEASRQYSGRFSGPPQFSPSGYNQWNIKATFIEIPGLAMNVYPTNWGVDSVFIEETDDFGSDNANYNVPANWSIHQPFVGTAHNNFSSYSNVTNEFAEVQYFGYGFRYWSLKQFNAGIVEVSLDGTVVGTADLYNASGVASSPLITMNNVALGFHRVKMRVTGTKNASSAGTYIFVDAIEVMR